MARALSLDLRERVIAAIEEGASCRAAELSDVGVASPVKGKSARRRAGRPDVEACEAWFEGQLDLDPDRVVSLE